MTQVQEWFVDQRSGVRMPAGVLRFPIDRCHIAPWNPNKQDPATFKNLVESIREDGFIDIPQLAPINTQEMRDEYCDGFCEDQPCWLIVGGAHRKDAGKMLDMGEIPGILIEGWSSDYIKFKNMRLNALKGRIDPDRFNALYEEMKQKGYEDDMLKYQFGLVQKNAMKKLIKQATKHLPTDVKKMVEDAEGEIESVDDLGRVLKELFSKHGDTLPFSYLVFEFGKKTNYWVRMERPVKEAVDRIAQVCIERKLDINRVLEGLFMDRAGLDAALGSALAKAKSEDDIFA